MNEIAFSAREALLAPLNYTIAAEGIRTYLESEPSGLSNRILHAPFLLGW